MITSISTIAYAGMAEIVFSTSKNSKYVVATDGLGPCVAIGGYHPSGIGFVAHFTDSTMVCNSKSLFFENLAKLLKEGFQKDPIQITLRGGWIGMSEETVEAIEELISSRPDIPMNITKEPLNELWTGKDISLDLRTGELSGFDISNNPALLKKVCLDLTKQEPISIVYFPKDYI